VFFQNPGIRSLLRMPSKIGTYIRGTGAGVASTVVQKGAGFASVWLLNRVLAKGAYGDYEFAFTVLSILLLAGSGGFNHAVLYRLSRLEVPEGKLAGENYVGVALGYSLILSLMVVAGIMLYTTFGLTSPEDQRIAFWLSSLSFLIPLRTARKTYKAWYQARQRVPEALLFHKALPALCKMLFLAGAWLFWPTPEAVVGAVLLAEILPFTFWFARSPVNLLRLKEGLARWDVFYSLKLALTMGLSKSVKNADIVMIGLLAGSEATAEYAVASRLASIITSSAHSTLNRILRPRVGRLLGSGREKELEAEYDQIRVVSLIVALGLALCCAVVGHYILEIFGAYATAYPILMVLVAGHLFHVSFGMTGDYLKVAGYAGWSLATTVGLLIGNVTLNWILITSFGGIGAAWATMCSYLAVNVVQSGIILRLDGIKVYNPSVLIATLGAVGVALGGALGVLSPVGTGVGIAAFWTGLAVLRREDLITVLQHAIKWSKEATT